jgi:hypothetical protein
MPESIVGNIVVAVLFLLCALVLFACFCSGSLAQRSEALQPAILDDWITDWYPPTTKPERVGQYKVRMPLDTADMVYMAWWNGTKWIDMTNGLECYFQQVEWCGLNREIAV